MKKRTNRQKVLGLERLAKLTKRSARERANLLEQNLDRNKYKAKVIPIAQRWMYWYRSYAKKVA